MRFGWTLFTLLACSGCNGGTGVVPEPGKITLQDALVSTVQAMNAAYTEARKPGNVLMGYYPCTMEASFNISAEEVTTNKIGLTVSASIPTTGVSLGGNASRDQTSTGQRGNVVKVVFASSVCLPGSADAAKPAAPSEKAASGTRASPGPRAGSGEVPKQTGAAGLPLPKQVWGLSPETR